MGPSGRSTHVGIILHYLEQVYAGIVLGQSSPYKEDCARFSKVASGNPTSTCISRVDG